MPTQLALFGSFSAQAVKSNNADVGGKQLAREGIDSALDACDDDWKRDALRQLKDLCERHHKVTADMLDTSGHRNAVGGLFSIARKKKWLKFSGEYTHSKNPLRHAGLIRVWESLIR